MEFEVVIGLEIHVQMNTKTKMFCGCDNDSFGVQPNTNVCPVCMGFPGQLPVLNEESLKKGLIASLAINCTIPNFSKFDRKQYFYPDSPKGFQISQYKEPIALDGYVMIDIDGMEKKIRVHRLHIEDDAGKLTHRESGTYLDFNRAGTPLMEIVSEPDMRSAKEARMYAEKIQSIMRACGSSFCDMEKGMMRFDASVSLRPKGDTKLYPRTEIKNLNSFRFLEEAINHEINKQKEMWEEGNPPEKESTAGWVEEKGCTVILRDKEGAADYRYIPEPDLPPIVLNDEYIEDLRRSLPELPDAKKKRYIEEFGLKDDDAYILSNDFELAGFFETVSKVSGNPKMSSNWVLSVLLGYMKDQKVALLDLKFTAENLGDLVKIIDSGEISSKSGKDIFDEMFSTGKDPNKIVEDKGLKQISDTSELENICRKAVDENPQAVEDIKGGKGRAIGALIAFVMKETRGQANPKMVNEIIGKMIK